MKRNLRPILSFEPRSDDLTCYIAPNDSLVNAAVIDGVNIRALHAGSFQLEFQPEESSSQTLAQMFPTGQVSVTMDCKVSMSRAARKFFFGRVFTRLDRLRWQLKRKGRPGWKS